MAVQQHVAASIFDIKLPARTAALVSLAILATVLTTVPTGQAQTFTVLHTFSGSDGDLPFAGLTMDRGRESLWHHQPGRGCWIWQCF
jgi:hypothetical protein